MALTVSLTGDWLTSVGNRRSSEGTITFDSVYATGGESLTAANVGLGVLDSLVLEQGVSGFIFEWDKDNNKVKVRRAGSDGIPTLVVEEAVTVTTHVGTLAHLPAYIVAVEVTAGASTPHCNVIPGDATSVAASEVSVVFTTGVMTFNATDAVTAARVTYFPQKEGTLFDASNLVVDETVTAAAAKVELANRAFAVQYVFNDTNDTLCALEPVGEAPSATNTAVVDITNGTPTTDIDTHADDDGDTLQVTYLKYSALPDPSMSLGDADVTLSSEAYNWTSDGGYPGLVVPGMGTQLVGEETATNVVAIWGGPSTTAAEDIARWRPAINDILTAQTGTMTTTAIPWFVLPAGADLFAEAGGAAAEATALDEIDASTDLSAVAVRFKAFGR
jgi:hypothetical protein